MDYYEKRIDALRKKHPIFTRIEREGLSMLNGVRFWGTVGKDVTLAPRSRVATEEELEQMSALVKDSEFPPCPLGYGYCEKYLVYSIPDHCFTGSSAGSAGCPYAK